MSWAKAFREWLKVPENAEAFVRMWDGSVPLKPRTGTPVTDAWLRGLKRRRDDDST